MTQQAAPTTHLTGCGLTLARDGQTVYPLTACCSAPARAVTHGSYYDPAAVCSGCFTGVADGFTLAAILGTTHARRDLVAILSGCTDCQRPARCAAELLAFYAPDSA